MQNLIDFLIRFRVFLGFLGLQLVCFFTYFQFVSYPRSVFLSGASNVNGTLLSWERSFFDYLHLHQQNRELQQENSFLRSVAFDQYYQIQRPLYHSEDTIYKQSFKYLPAQVINTSILQRNNYFTINAGSVQQVKKGMGVISNNGVVGIVFKVGEHFSLVKSVLTSDINLDVVVGKSELRGILKWNGKNPKIGSITGLSSDLSVKKWSAVRTQGATGIFPKGILLGKVKEIRQMENQSLWDIDMLYQEDFRTVRFVYVIQSLIADEIQQLQFSIPHSNPE